MNQSDCDNIYFQSGKRKSVHRLRLEEYYKEFIQNLMQSSDRPAILPRFVNLSNDICQQLLQKMRNIIFFPSLLLQADF